MQVCISETMCFLTLLLGAPGQSAFTDGVTATAAQTAEVCSCAVPLTESYRDHVVWTQHCSTMENVRKGIFREVFKLMFFSLNPATGQRIIRRIYH